MSANIDEYIKNYRFKTDPYNHQRDAFITNIRKKNWAYFMEMGTGKTKVGIDTYSFYYSHGYCDSLLIVAPKGVYRNWVGEIGTHMPDHIERQIGVWSSTPKKEEKKALDRLFKPEESFKILIMNIEAFSTKRGTDFAIRFLKTMAKPGMIVDESTSIKNPKAARTKNVIKAGRNANIKRIMSGEPVTQSPLDLFSQCDFMHPELLGFGSYYAMRNRYAVMKDMIVKQGGSTRRFKKVTGFQRLDELQDKLKEFSTRIKKEDCLDLPPKVYMTRDVELTDEQKKVYNQMVNEAIAELRGEVQVTAPLVLTRLLRLHQIVCGILPVEDSDTVIDLENNRISALMETLDECTGKVIIWANYRRNIIRIEEELRKRYGDDSVGTYFGGTSSDERQEVVRAFQDEQSNLRFFVGNPQTGGFGITLTQADTVVYYSNTYNLEHRLQSEDRAHRIGQTRSVTYVDLVARGTVDEKIIAALGTKRNLAADVMDNWEDMLI